MPKLTPSQPGRDIYCFIAGAFRPPNWRQWQMISYYSDLVGPENEVIVIVSNPKSDKSQHRMADGRAISSEDAVRILEIFRDSENRSNVTIMESEEASPVRTVYGIVTDPESFSDCDILIGCYRDEADFKKWDRLEAKAAEDNPSVTILDYRKFAYRRSYENFAHVISSLQRRTGGVTLEDETDVLPKFLSDAEKEKVLQIIYPDGAIRRKATEKEDEPKINEAAENVLAYENFGDFVEIWSDVDPKLNVVKDESYDAEKKELTIRFHQPRRGQELLVKVSNVEQADADDWKDEVFTDEEEAVEVTKFATSAKFLSEMFSYRISGDIEFVGIDKDSFYTFKDNSSDGELLKVEFSDKDKALLKLISDNL